MVEWNNRHNGQVIDPCKVVLRSIGHKVWSGSVFGASAGFKTAPGTEIWTADACTGLVVWVKRVR